MVNFIILVLVFVLSIVLLKFGWDLFMVPVFYLDKLEISEAFGLALIIGALRPTNVKL